MGPPFDMGPVSEKLFTAGNELLERRSLDYKAIDSITTGFSHVKTFMMPILEVTSEEYDKMLNTMTKELRDFNTYQPIIRAYACKKKRTDDSNLT
ncbi:12375_t:CDS:2 [Acaulospora morrowiae]|uniref:12375_t:CDS:1 n=1 Tax=Acaulospora morrowiae TaxID=94023 RepID=A0A9N9BTH0_9GLOM|nr:12375_t:CDS:2 [Acaulospora morrowiae]